jgi:geranylgeranyl diphosphate synthase type I
MTQLAPDPIPVHPPDILRRTPGLVEPALRAAVEALDPQLALMGSYAFGWCDADGAPTCGGSGKMLRSTLALLSARLVGKPPRTALRGAVAVELLHVFSLIHDDIMDGDEQRRHRPAVWKAYGVGPAILAGDALFALAMRTVAHSPAQAVEAAGQLLGDAAVRLCRGQAQDLAFERRPWTGPDEVTGAEYQAMAADKTGALISCSLAIGALLAGAPVASVQSLARVGHEFGLAFQIVDDVLSGTDNPSVTGKPVLGDLRTGKKTYPILAALACPRAGSRLGALLSAGNGPLSDEDLAEASALVRGAGGYQQAMQEARRRVERGLAELSHAGFEGEVVDDLSVLAAFLLDRSA